MPPKKAVEPDSGYASMEEEQEELPPLVNAPKRKKTTKKTTKAKETKKVEEPKAKKPTTSAMKTFLENEKKTYKINPMTEDELNFLMKMFFDTKETFGMGRDRMFKYIEINYPDKKIARRKINRFLQSLEITQLFNPIKATKDIAVNISKAPFNRFEMDLMDMSNMESDGFNFIFNLVDTFSKYVISIPLKSKDDKTVLAGMKKAMKELKDKFKQQPKTILSDNGSEFINMKFRAYTEKEGIKQIFTKAETDTSHAKQVENFNGYLRRQIAKYDNQFDNPRWNEYLQTLIDNYNKSPSRITKKTPIAIMEGDDAGVKENIEKNVLPKNDKRFYEMPFKKGDVVRLKQEMGSTFEKPSNNIRWSREFYVIDKTLRPKSESTLQPKYTIRTYEDNKRIEGFFYRNDLREVSPDLLEKIQQEPKFIVQKLLDIKNFKENGVVQRKVLVKWDGYKEPSWEYYGVIKEDTPKLLKNLESKLKRQKK